MKRQGNRRELWDSIIQHNKYASYLPHHGRGWGKFPSVGLTEHYTETILCEVVKQRHFWKKTSECFKPLSMEKQWTINKKNWELVCRGMVYPGRKRELQMKK